MTLLERLSKTVRADRCIMLSHPHPLNQEGYKQEVDTMPSIEDVYPSDLLSAKDIVEFGEKKMVVIKEAKVEQVGQGANASNKIVISFAEIPKRLAANKTNANKIAEITGNKDYTQWQGVALELYNITTTFRGQEVQAIRVRKPEPAADPGAAPPAASSLIEQKFEEGGKK